METASKKKKVQKKVHIMQINTALKMKTTLISYGSSPDCHYEKNPLLTVVFQLTIFRTAGQHSKHEENYTEASCNQRGQLLS